MPFDTRIRIRYPARKLFQMRVAGLAFRDGYLLVHREVHERFWTLPGGRAEFGETTSDTLAREMVEELGCTVEVKELFWIAENFFTYEAKKWHEMGFYYHMVLPADFPFHESEIVYRAIDGKSKLEFKWVKATCESLRELNLPPYFLAEQIEDLPKTPRHIIWDDGNLDLSKLAK